MITVSSNFTDLTNFIQGGVNMNVNGITGTNETSYPYTADTQTDTGQQTATAEEISKDSINSSGVIYEPSDGSAAISSAATISDAKKLQREAIISQMKADSEARTAQLQDIVEQMISKQGSTYASASGDNMWKILSSGDFTVDAATKKQAQEDISEDGYYGVKKTSDRIVDFAQALAGDDTSKLEDMRQAFIKGYNQATKTWGKELPQISQDTYKAVMDKFDALEGKTSDDTTDSTTTQA